MSLDPKPQILKLFLLRGTRGVLDYSSDEDLIGRVLAILGFRVSGQSSWSR